MLYLIRHGEAEGNAQGRIMGQRDWPLTATGRAQAAALGRWLAAGGTALAAVYGSDLQRAAETAAILVDACGGGPVRLRPDLRELGRGELEGRTYAEAAELRRSPEVALGLEPDAAVAARLHRAAAELRAAALEAPVAAVAHGGSISRLLSLFLGLGAAGGPAAPGFALDNTAVSVLDFTAGRTQVLCLNAVCHLAPALPRWVGPRRPGGAG